MTNRKINKELEGVYKERKKWNGGKGPLTKSVVKQRELVLIKQNILYRIEDAKLPGDKGEESFNLALYKIINDYLKTISEIYVKRRDNAIQTSN
jgi:hypothetical protein